MKKRMLGTCVLAICAASAAHAEAPHNWSGVYAGASLGYGEGDTSNDWSNATITWQPDGEIAYDGAMLGAHIGYQAQFGRWVVGAETDFTFTDFDGDDAQVAGVVNGVQIEDFHTLRARVGWAHGASLYYLTGGVAHSVVTKTDASLLNLSEDETVTGWTAGAGYERALGAHWRARAEYQYVDLGNTETMFDGGGGAYYLHRANDITFQALRLGLSYAF